MSISETTERKELNNPKTAASDSWSPGELRNSIPVDYVWDEATRDSGLEPTRSNMVSIPTAGHDQDIAFIAQLAISLMQKVDEMSQEIAGLKDTMLSMKSEASSEKLDNTRENLMELTREEVKIKILQLYEQDKELDYYDIISRCDIALELVVQICAELENEGKIEVIE